MKHKHTFTDQGERTDTGEIIKNCTDERCDALQDSDGGIII